MKEKLILPDFEFDKRVTQIIENGSYIQMLHSESSTAINTLSELSKKCQKIAEKNLIEDRINKINKIKIINIPNEASEQNYFCILPEKVDGVTEKIALISLDRVIHFFKTFNIIDQVVLEDIKILSFKTEAILKLPKHGNPKEVLSEAIALNIARILEFRTTRSTLVTHHDKPALFIPFDDIQLISKFAGGETQTIFLASPSKIGKKYLHRSTILPVGNQLNPDYFLEDFGLSFAFFYLCNDLDFMGGDNQNKAIIDEKKLYIFDQVINLNDGHEIDTRLHYIYTNIYKKFIRHFQCRNRRIVEDSCFENKFDSITLILQKKDEIMGMIQKASIHLADLCEANKPCFDLLKHVLDIRNTVERRMHDVLKHFPKFESASLTVDKFKKHSELIKKALILQKLLNPIVLFTNDGRPYKNPRSIKIETRIKNIQVRKLNTEEGDFVQLEFTKSINLSRLKKIFLPIEPEKNLYFDNNILSIYSNDFYRIKERAEFILPELQINTQNIPYLDQKEIKSLHDNYGMQALTDYFNVKFFMFDLKKVESLVNIFDYFKVFQSSLSIGFAKHFKLKLHYEIQKKLLSMHPEIRKKLARAFNAAMKLDRLEDFHQVVILYTEQDSDKDDLLEVYLDNCIQCFKRAKNYNFAITESQQLLELSQNELLLLNPKEEKSPSYALMSNSLNLQKLAEKPNILTNNDSVNGNTFLFQNYKHESKHRDHKGKGKEEKNSDNTLPGLNK